MSEDAKELPEAVPNRDLSEPWKTRPVLQTHPNRSARVTAWHPQAREVPLLFESIQEASRALTDVQERLEVLAQRLVGEIQTWTPAERPTDGAGLLLTAGKCARNMRSRAEHIRGIVILLEEALG